MDLNFYVNNIFVHEIALHPEHDPEDFRPPFYVATNPSSRTPVNMTPAYVNAIMSCLSSAQSVLRIFFTMEVQVARACPSLLFVRILYSSVLLIKLDMSARGTSSKIGRVLDPESLQVQSYLDNALKHMTKIVGSDGRNLLPSKFFMILRKLNMWYRKQSGRPDAKDGGESLEPLKYFAARFNPEEHSVLRCQPGVSPSLNSSLDEQPAAVQSSPTLMDSERRRQRAAVHPPSKDSSHSFTHTQLTQRRPAAGNTIADFSAPPTTSAQSGFGLDNTYSPNLSTAGQASTDYSSPEYNLQAANNVPYDFPMEVNQSMFTHLVDAEPFPANQDTSWMANDWMSDGVDYSNMQDINWTLSDPWINFPLR